MLLAIVDTPLTVKAEVPALLLILVPASIDKVDIVWVTCKSQAAVPVITTSVDDDKLPLNLKVPALMFVSPV